MLGKGLHRLPFSFSLDFHPMVEVTAFSLTSQIPSSSLETQSFDPLFTNITPLFSPRMVLIQAAPVAMNRLRGVTALRGLGRISSFSRDSGFCSSTAEVKMIPSALELKFNFLSAAQGTDFPLGYWQQVRKLHSKLNCFENSPGEGPHSACWLQNSALAQPGH